MKEINERIEEYLLNDQRLMLLVRALKREPDMLRLQFTEEAGNELVLNNAQLMEIFKRNKRMICSIAIF